MSGVWRRALRRGMANHESSGFGQDNLIALLRKNRHIRSDQVEKAMRTINRRDFVPEERAFYAYSLDAHKIGDFGYVPPPAFLAYILVSASSNKIGKIKRRFAERKQSA